MSDVSLVQSIDSFDKILSEPVKLRNRPVPLMTSFESDNLTQSRIYSFHNDNMTVRFSKNVHSSFYGKIVQTFMQIIASQVSDSVDEVQLT